MSPVDSASTVCIVVPVYNARQHLEECVASIREQTYDNLDIFLIDDGSTDGCSDICDRLEKDDSRIHVYRKENQGPSATRNLGIEKARGDYLAFVDADDLLTPRAIEAMVFAAQSSRADLVISGFQRFSSKKKSKPRVYAQERIVFNTQEQLASLYCKTTTNMFGIAVWGKLYKLAILKQNNLSFRTDVNYEEDCLFNLTVFPLVNRCVLLPDVLYLYRQQEESLSKGYRPDAFPQLAQGYRARVDYVLRSGIPEAQKALGDSFLVVYETLVTKIWDSNLTRSEKNREFQRLLDAPEIQELPTLGIKTKMRYKQALLNAAKTGDVEDVVSAVRGYRLRAGLKSVPGYSLARRAVKKFR